MKDDLGTRMKEQYELRCRYMLPRRTNTILRLDGKAFHTYTRGRERPFDQMLHENLVNAAAVLFNQAQGAKLAYIQSDEVSLLLTDYDSTQTCAWFDGNVQKLTSVAASILTAEFNCRDLGRGAAYFDCRAFTIPDPVEVHNYFVWRQKDAERNSLSMLAQAHYSHRELDGKRRADLHEMLHAKGVNWNDANPSFKSGTAIRRTGDGELFISAAPIFTQRTSWITDMLPSDDVPTKGESK